MKILYFTQFYPPESIAAAFRAKENAQIWVNNNCEVTVFTGYPNYPKGKVFDGFRVKRIEESYDGNIRLIRSKIIAKPNTSLFKRLINATSFLFYGILNIRFKKKIIGNDYDVVLASSGTIFTGMLGWKYAKKNKKPFVFEVRDITYRQLIATGKKENSFAVKKMKKIELNLCRKAQKVVVVTHGFKKILIEDGVPEEKIEVITNGINVSDICDNSRMNGVSLSYFGTLGISQNIKNLFNYLPLFKEIDSSFTFNIIGDGAQKKEIQDILQNGNFKYVEMLDGMPSEKLEGYYRKTNLSIVTLVNSEHFRYTIPSKLFQILGRGIPVLYIGPDGEAADIIRNSNSGLVLCGNLEQNLKVLRDFLSQPNLNERLTKMGGNGRQLVKDYYDREKLAICYLDLLSKCSQP